MQHFRSKITKNGTLLIPAALRKELNLQPGDEVLLRVRDKELHIGTQKLALAQSRKLVRKYIQDNVCLSGKLIHDRKSRVN